MGAAAQSAVPDMLKALWGRDQQSRDQILEAIHKIDPQVTVSRVDGHAVMTGVILARDAIRGKPATPQNKMLDSSLEQLMANQTWYTREELTDFATKLAAKDQDTYRAFVKGILEDDPSLKNLFQPTGAVQP